MPAGRYYEFGSFRLDPTGGVLFRDGERLALTPKAIEVLTLLVEAQGSPVTKDELLQRVWADAIVEEGTLTSHISVLRKALGVGPDSAQYIETIPKRGYRFVVPVLVTTNSSDSRTSIERAGRERRRWKIIVPVGVAAVLAAGGLLWRTRNAPVLTEKDAIVVADFTNTTGDAVFDGTLRQGLTVQLEQSPFLSLVSEDRIQQTLRLMGQPDVRLTPEVAREICERTASAAVLDGSIATLGSQYVLGLKAVNCRTGDHLAQEQATADGKEQVLPALTRMASGVRAKLGESLASIQKLDKPLEQATTSSLEALKAYSLAWEARERGGDESAIPLLKKALEIDPSFAMAHAVLGTAYGNMGERSAAKAECEKAFEFRDRVSERERFYVLKSYYDYVTGELSKTVETYRLWIQTYPRDDLPHGNLGIAYATMGQPEKALEEFQEAARLAPESALLQDNLAYGYLGLRRLDEAKAVIEQAIARKVEDVGTHMALQTIAFLQGDCASMEREALWARGQPGEHEILANEAAIAAYQGRISEARKLSREAAEIGQRTGMKEHVAFFLLTQSLAEASFGFSPQARKLAIDAVGISRDRDVLTFAAADLAMAGDVARAESAYTAAEKEFAANDTLAREVFLPMARAHIELGRRHPGKALELTQPGRSYAAIGVPYVRGLAYLLAGKGADAGREFLVIGEGGKWSWPFFLGPSHWPFLDVAHPLSHLGLARAYALQGDDEKARAAYQDFLTLWKDADPDIPILKQAKAEYAKLQ